MSHDDFNFEPIRGLPEALPEDEHILWQGSPDPWRLACEAYKLKWVAAYFALLALWRFGVSSADFPLATAAGHAVPLVILGFVACGVLYVLGLIQARSAVYTLTNKRVAMRIGAALTMTLNLPYTWIGNASLAMGRKGHGTLAFELIGETRLSYIMSWPHVRPWRITRTQPALRAIPDAEAVAAIFTEAAETRIHAPVVTRDDPQPTPSDAIVAE